MKTQVKIIITEFSLSFPTNEAHEKKVNAFLGTVNSNACTIQTSTAVNRYQYYITTQITYLAQ